MYLDHFGLSQFPFSATPDTQFFLDLGNSRPTFADLIKELNRPDGFVVITGQAGMGKTTLCRKLINSINCHRSRYTTLYLAYPHLDPIGLFQAIAHELGLDETLRPTLRTDVEESLRSLHQKGQRVILIIDEAQAMPIETLDTLRELATETVDHRQLLQPVLFGQPALQVLLESIPLRALRERLTSNWVLEAMDSDTSAQYIAHRLQGGGSSTGLFSTEALTLIARASGGIPRLVNLIAHKALLAAWREQQTSVAKCHVRDAISETYAVNSKFQSPQHISWLHRISRLRSEEDTRPSRRGVVSR